ncbi:MAG: tetratricopeptide repeat protein [Pseudomonadota bacterium]
MAENEEEQVKELKEWWDKNGKSVIAGVVIGIGALVGWKGWTTYHERQAMEASDLYNTMQKYLLARDLEAFALQAGVLKDNYGSTPYASLGALILAKANVEDGDYPLAIENLQWVVNHSNQETLQTIAQLRLARIYISEGELDKAEKVLLEEYPNAYNSLKQELLGDLYASQGDYNAALKAYDAAIHSAEEGDIEYLQMKRDNIHSEDTSNA